jgi:hypothetical protein
MNIHTTAAVFAQITLTVFGALGVAGITLFSDAIAQKGQGTTLAKNAVPWTAHGQDSVLVVAVMRSQYGDHWDASAGCWIHKTVDLGSYCMKPVQQHLVAAHDGSRLYLLAEGLPVDGTGAIQEIGTHAAPGLVGAFAIALSGPQGDEAPDWRVLAASKELRFGSFGRAGVAWAKFVLIGPSDYYGWTFVSGGTWQGVTVGSHVILAPLGPRFVDIATIPSMTEEDQEHRIDIAIDDTAKGVRVYPLTVSKRRLLHGKVSGAAIETMTIPFDERRWKYKWPVAE